jgi:hypothetical protein
MPDFSSVVDLLLLLLLLWWLLLLLWLPLTLLLLLVSTSTTILANSIMVFKSMATMFSTFQLQSRVLEIVQWPPFTGHIIALAIP